MDKYVIITAGGSGERMGSELPKQFLEIHGKPILRHTIEAFLSLPFQIKILLVLSERMIDYWKDYCLNNNFNIRHTLVKGGFTRFHSVKKAAALVPDNCIVAIHDGVRPIVDRDFLLSLFGAAENSVSKSIESSIFIPTIGLSDSIRIQVEEGKTRSVERSKFRLVQTPQITYSNILKESYEQPYSVEFTDDASVVESAGYCVNELEGVKSNIKITIPDDLVYAELFLKPNDEE